MTTTKAEVAILISDRKNFNLKMVKRNKEGHYIINDKDVNSSRFKNVYT